MRPARPGHAALDARRDRIARRVAENFSPVADAATAGRSPRLRGGERSRIESRVEIADMPENSEKTPYSSIRIPFEFPNLCCPTSRSRPRESLEARSEAPGSAENPAKQRGSRPAFVFPRVIYFAKNV